MYEYEATMIRAVDGDTVELTVDLGFRIVVREHFRIVGYDSPEMRDPDPSERIRAAQAKEAIISLLAGKVLVIKTIKGPRSSQKTLDRWLAHIFYRTETGDLISVAEQMKALGHIKAVPPTPPPVL